MNKFHLTVLLLFDISKFVIAVISSCDCEHIQCQSPIIRSICESDSGVFVAADNVPNDSNLCICCDYCIFNKKKDESCAPDANPLNIIKCSFGLKCEEYSQRCNTDKKAIQLSESTDALLEPIKKLLPPGLQKELANGLADMPAKSLEPVIGYIVDHATDHEKLSQSLEAIGNKFQSNVFFKQFQFYFQKLSPDKMVTVLKALLLLPLKQLTGIPIDQLLSGLQMSQLESLMKLVNENGLNDIKMLALPHAINSKLGIACKPSMDINYKIVGHIYENGINYEVQQGSSIRGVVSIDRGNILVSDPNAEILDFRHQRKRIKRVQRKQNSCSKSV